MFLELRNTKIYGLVEQKHFKKQRDFATRGPKFLCFVIHSYVIIII